MGTVPTTSSGVAVTSTSGSGGIYDDALEEAGRVLKRQRTCAARSIECLDKALALVTQTKERLRLGTGDGAMLQLRSTMETLGLSTALNSHTKELHSSISKLSKAVDKVFDGQHDICKALRSVTFDEDTLNQVIAEHLCREGRFEIADCFLREANFADADEIKGPYASLHSVLQQMKARNLAPALAWAEEHRAQLCTDGSTSSFEFKLHALSFIHKLETEGQAAALKYARATFPSFSDDQMCHIQRLMGCMLYSNKPPEQTPYKDLLSPAHWDELALEFTRQACNLMGQACDSPLAVVVAAGSVALPALLKLASVMERNGQDFHMATQEQLPIELELGEEFVYHSIFACPVSKDQSSSDNPPMLLPCNHVLCEQSVIKIAKSRSRIFKCPYCPMEARADNLRPLIFPDVQ